MKLNRYVTTLTRAPHNGPVRALSGGMIRQIFTRISPVSLSGLVAVFCLATAAQAQVRPTPLKPQPTVSKRKISLPPGFAPPSGMCRIWIDNVPADQQPAPTDCASAVKNRPLNGKVIFGEQPKAETGKVKRDDNSI